MNISETELIGIIIFIVCITVLIKNLEFLTRRGFRRYLSYRDVREFEEKLEKLEETLEK